MLAPHIATSLALKPYQVKPQANPAKKLMVLVRREDTTIQEVEVMEEYRRFTKKYFPKYEQKFLQFPEVFATKLKTEGFPEKKKNVEPAYSEWYTHAAGETAEYALFRFLEKEFSDRPALSMNSLEIRKLLLVSKQTLDKKRNERKELMKKKNPNIIELPLTEEELHFFEVLGNSVANLMKDVDEVIKCLFDGDGNTLEVNIEKFIKGSKIKDDKQIACRCLFRKITGPNFVNKETPNKEDVKNFIGYNIWKKNVDKNQEFDNVLIDKLTSNYLHFEVKSVTRDVGNHIEKGLKSQLIEGAQQLQFGKALFQDLIAPLCNLTSDWTYTGGPS